MAYNYLEQKPNIFKEENQQRFLDVRDKAHRLLKEQGWFRMEEATSEVVGDTWDQLACVDRLVELGEIKEIPTDGPNQHRIFTSKG